jgi:hypothetical protein
VASIHGAGLFDTCESIDHQAAAAELRSPFGDKHADSKEAAAGIRICRLRFKEGLTSDIITLQTRLRHESNTAQPTSAPSLLHDEVVSLAPALASPGGLPLVWWP